MRWTILNCNLAVSSRFYCQVWSLSSMQYATRSPYSRYLSLATDHEATNTVSRMDKRILNKSSRERRSKLGATTTFKQFLRRQRVVHQYRGFMKALSKIDDPIWRDQLKCDVRTGYGINKKNQDDLAIQMAIKEGDVRLKQLYSMVGYNDVSTSKLKGANEESNGSSWLHIKDDIDKRGRVGQEWPWHRA